MNLILFQPNEVSDTDAGSAERHVTLSDARARHLLTVLRVKPGDHVRVGILDGPLGVATVRSVADDAVALRCAFDATIPPRPRVDLLLALPRPKVMRRLWAQIAALGVGHIILTNAERVERNYFDTHVLQPECYEPLLVEGLRQARDTRRPRVSIHRQLKVLIEDHLDALFPGGVRLVAHPATEKSPGDVLGHIADDKRLLLAVGPEGGWNAFEMGLFEEHGFTPAGLGRRILRTDTACVALLAVVHDALNFGSARV
jgi:RsmE family RNA methyltransferase